MSPEALRLRSQIRAMVGVFIVGLVLSGLTAFPLLHELNLLVRLLGAETEGPQGSLALWVLRVRDRCMPASLPARG